MKSPEENAKTPERLSLYDKLERDLLAREAKLKEQLEERQKEIDKLNSKLAGVITPPAEATNNDNNNNDSA